MLERNQKLKALYNLSADTDEEVEQQSNKIIEQRLEIITLNIK